MRIRVQKWGNSLAVRIPRSFARETALKEGTEVELELENALRDLQLLLLQAPDAGSLDPGTGGLRKVRIPDPERGKGKRSGARVHYLWIPSVSLIYLLYVYTKNESSTPSRTEKRQLRAVVEAIKREWMPST